MPAWLIPAAISGVSALAGLLGNRKKQAQQESTQTVNQQLMPQYDDKALYMRNLLMDQFNDRTRLNEDFFQGYQNQGMQNINQASDALNRNIMQTLSARGLNSSSAGASSMVQAALNRLNQQSSFLNTIPLLKDQRQKENLAAASNFFTNLPTGRSITGTTTSKGTTTQPGNMLGGAFGALANSLFGLYGMGAFDSKGGGNSTTNIPIPSEGGIYGTPTGIDTTYDPNPYDYDWDPYAP